jgi:hypothetical protein
MEHLRRPDLRLHVQCIALSAERRRIPGLKPGDRFPQRQFAMNDCLLAYLEATFCSLSVEAFEMIRIEGTARIREQDQGAAMACGAEKIEVIATAA